MAFYTGQEKRIGPAQRNIGIFGDQGSHTHETFLHHFEKSADGYRITFCPSPPDKTPAWIFQRLIEDVATGRVDCCLIPFFNTLAERFDVVFRLLFDNEVKIVDVFDREIVQNLISTRDIQRKEDVKLVISNRPCFLQTQAWRRDHMPGVATHESPASSEAKLLIQRNAAGGKCALIGAQLLTKLYPELHIIEPGIQGGANFTSFFVVSKITRAITGNPFSLYAFPVRALEDKARIDEQLQKISMFSVVFTWYVLDGEQQKQPYLYCYQLATGEDENKIKTFESLLGESIPNFKCWGRLSKEVEQYMIKKNSS